MSDKLITVGNFDCVAGGYDDKYLLPIGNSLNSFYDLTEQYEQIKSIYEDNRFKLEQLCQKAYDEIGFKSLKSEYIQVTFVPATEGKERIEKKLSEAKVRELLEGLGYEGEELEEQFNTLCIVETKTSGARKCSIRITKE